MGLDITPLLDPASADAVRHFEGLPDDPAGSSLVSRCAKEIERHRRDSPRGAVRLTINGHIVLFGHGGYPGTDGSGTEMVQLVREGLERAEVREIGFATSADTWCLVTDCEAGAEAEALVHAAWRVANGGSRQLLRKAAKRLKHAHRKRLERYEAPHDAVSLSPNAKQRLKGSRRRRRQQTGCHGGPVDDEPNAIGDRVA